MKTVTLRIRESTWSGRALSQPPPTERDLRLPADGTFALTFHSERFICAVAKISADAVELAPLTMPPAQVSENGGIGPSSMATPTRLALGQSLTVSTWALDLGATWKITVQHIET